MKLPSHEFQYSFEHSIAADLTSVWPIDLAACYVSQRRVGKVKQFNVQTAVSVAALSCTFAIERANFYNGFVPANSNKFRYVNKDQFICTNSSIGLAEYLKNWIHWSNQSKLIFFEKRNSTELKTYENLETCVDDPKQCLQVINEIMFAKLSILSSLEHFPFIRKQWKLDVYLTSTSSAYSQPQISSYVCQIMYVYPTYQEKWRRHGEI